MPDARSKMPIPQVAGPAGGDAGAAAGYAGMAREMGALSDQFMQIHARKVTAKAKTLGGQEGSELGWKPRDGVTLADEAYNAAGLAANKAAVQSDIRRRVDDLAAEHEFDAVAFSNQVGVGAEGLTGSGYAAGILEGVPESYRGEAAAYLVERASYRMRKIQQGQRARERNGRESVFRGTFEDLAVDYDEAAREFGVESEQAQNVMAMVFEQADMATGSVDPETGIPTIDPSMAETQVGALLDEIERRGHIAHYRGEFERTGNKQGYLSAFRKGGEATPYKLSGNDRKALMGEFRAEISRQKAERTRMEAEARAARTERQNSAERLVENVTTAMANGHPVPPEMEAAAYKASAEFPELVSELNTANEGATHRARMAYMSGPEVDEYIRSLESKYPGTAERSTMVAGLRTFADSHRKARYDRGQEEAHDVGLIDMTARPAPDDPGYHEAVRADLDKIEAAWGWRPSPYTKAQRDWIARRIYDTEDPNPGDVVSILGGTLAEHGAGALEELGMDFGDERPVLGAAAAIYGMEAASGRPRDGAAIAYDVLAGEQVLRDKPMNMPTDKQVASVLSDYLGGSLQAWEGFESRLVPAVRALAAEYGRAANVGEYDHLAPSEQHTDVLKQAMERIVPNVQEVNGAKTLAPEGEEDLEEWVQNLRGGYVEKIGVPPAFTEEVGGAERAAQAINDGELVALDRAGRYVVVTSMPDGSKGPILGEDGEPWVLEYHEDWGNDGKGGYRLYIEGAL